MKHAEDLQKNSLSKISKVNLISHIICDYHIYSAYK